MSVKTNLIEDDWIAFESVSHHSISTSQAKQDWYRRIRIGGHPVLDMRELMLTISVALALFASAEGKHKIKTLPFQNFVVSIIIF